MPLTFAGDVVRSAWTLCVAGGVLTLVQGVWPAQAWAPIRTREQDRDRNWSHSRLPSKACGRVAGLRAGDWPVLMRHVGLGLPAMCRSCSLVGLGPLAAAICQVGRRRVTSRSQRLIRQPPSEPGMRSISRSCFLIVFAAKRRPKKRPRSSEARAKVKRRAARWQGALRFGVVEVDFVP